MKICTFSAACLLAWFAHAQTPNTDVYLFDYQYSNGKLDLSNFKNISDNDGYDNQPSFANDTYLLFSSNRGGQTDIAQYYIPYGSKVFINYTAGSEYSPMKIPNEEAISSIRLEQDGTQKLYKYSLITADADILIDNIVVAYQLWYDENTLVSAVIEDDNLSLYVTELPNKTNKRLDTEIGRALQLVPNSSDISYVSKKNKDAWEIRSLNIKTGKSKLLVPTLKGAEDFVWLNKRTLLMGSGSKLYTYDITRDKNWQEVNDIQRFGIGNISRLAINESIGKLAVVGEPNGAIVTDPQDDQSSSPANGSSEIQKSGVAAIIENHLNGYNARDINAFMAPFSEDIQIYYYPDKLSADGSKAVREEYVDFFGKVKNLNAEVLDRIILGNKIVDHERVTMDGNIVYAIAVYEVNNGKITRVTYIQ